MVLSCLGDLPFSEPPSPQVFTRCHFGTRTGFSYGFIKGLVLLFILFNTSKNSVCASSSRSLGVQPDVPDAALNREAGLRGFIQAYTFMHFRS